MSGAYPASGVAAVRPARRAVVAAVPATPAVVARSATSVMGASASPVTQPQIIGSPLPPLGPERYYPNGIAPLRPEFMHQSPAEVQRR